MVFQKGVAKLQLFLKSKLFLVFYNRKIKNNLNQDKKLLKFVTSYGINL